MSDMVCNTHGCVPGCGDNEERLVDHDGSGDKKGREELVRLSVEDLIALCSPFTL